MEPESSALFIHLYLIRNEQLTAFVLEIGSFNTINLSILRNIMHIAPEFIAIFGTWSEIYDQGIN